MRGKPGRGRIRRPGLGLIPAHAGKTLADVVRAIVGGAHPRACGENGGTGADLFGFAGSSPRMRGKPRLATVSAMRSGLIPAHAGKTAEKTEVLDLSAAHPRACGENGIPTEIVDRATGSSPRMRGKPRLPKSTRAIKGLIPAHAGKTTSNNSTHNRLWAHPRACGENRDKATRMDSEAGSSPRMRGKRTETVAEEGSAGLIPAHAGKTSSA